MSLAPEHREGLYKSGLTDSTIEVEDFRSALPEDIKRFDGVLSALKISYHDIKGEPTGHSRLRLHPPYINGEGKVQKYWQAPGSDSDVFLSRLVNWLTIAPDPLKEVDVTEGEKKASAGCQAGLSCIGIPGVWNWFQRLSADERIVVPTLKLFRWQGRKVRLIPDSDVWKPENFNALCGFFALGMELVEDGTHVEFLKLLESGQGKVGLDDYLVKHKGDKEALNYLERIPLTDSSLKKVIKWWQRWCKKQAAREADRGVLLYRRADSIEMRPISWLWPGRIARGKTSLIAGHPGLGKSQVSVSMAAVVTTGGTFPLADTPCEVGNVIVLSAEDGAEDTLTPRLRAAGADMRRVFIIDAVQESPLIDGTRVFDLKKDLDKLEPMLQAIGGAVLIVIDPISAYLGKTDSHKNAEVRSVLTPLSAFAEQHGVAIVGISHFSKDEAAEAILRITGSLAFVAAARSAYVVAVDPENPARRLFLPLKNNLGADQSGLAFSLESVQLESPNGLIKTSHVLWEAKVVRTTAAHAMRPPDAPEERSELTDAMDFLQTLLANGGVSPNKLQEAAKQAGIAWRTVERAKAALKVKSKKGGMNEGWTWCLPPTPEDSQNSSTLHPSNSWRPSDSSGEVGGLQGDKTESPPPEDRQESPKAAKTAKNSDVEPSGGVVGGLQENGIADLLPPPPNGQIHQELEGGQVSNEPHEATDDPEIVVDF